MYFISITVAWLFPQVTFSLKDILKPGKEKHTFRPITTHIHSQKLLKGGLGLADQCVLTYNYPCIQKTISNYLSLTHTRSDCSHFLIPAISGLSPCLCHSWWLKLRNCLLILSRMGHLSASVIQGTNRLRIQRKSLWHDGSKRKSPRKLGTIWTEALMRRSCYVGAIYNQNHCIRFAVEQHVRKPNPEPG